MNIMDGIKLAGGLILLLFGMRAMSNGLKTCAGPAVYRRLRRATRSRIYGFLTGFGVTAMLQSSSVTTVLLVGLLNAGFIDLGQAIPVIFGANVGTTVSAWLLLLRWMGPWSGSLNYLTPLLALVGLVLFFSSGKKAWGISVLGLVTVLFGMDMMARATQSLQSLPQFKTLLLQLSSPVSAVLYGTLLTAVLQSSSAAVGILQAFCQSRTIPMVSAAAVLIGQNIGTCTTMLLAALGAQVDARRAAVVHLIFNLFGAAIWLPLCYLLSAYPIFARPADPLAIAVFHTAFNCSTAILLLPLYDKLRLLTVKLVRARSDTRPALKPDTAL